MKIYANGATTSSSIALPAEAVLAAGSTFVVCHSSANAAIKTACQLQSGSLSFNGDDAVSLACDGVEIDVFGKIGEDPGTSWSGGGISTVDRTLRRKCGITTGDLDGSDAFDPSIQWDGFPVDTTDGLGAHSVICPDPCEGVTCSNQGTCQPDGSSYTCLCNEGYSGVDCSGSCSDGAQNGTETGIDCGPDCSLACDGEDCAVHGDCKSDYCNNTTLKCATPTCSDGAQNGDETGVDCGGSCGACDGDACAANGDCKSGYCNGTVCAAPTCTDGAQNGEETGVDCGGSCLACEGDSCTQDSDCVTGFCLDNETCWVPDCTDGIKNGSETDIDCGGPCAEKCADGLGCNLDAECLSGSCLDHTCEAAYRHTVPLDGTNDFAAVEEFPTTSAGYVAYATWDADYLYVGYQGSDIGATATATKWVQIYLDVDPDDASGASTGVTYNTQTPSFPAGLRPDFHFGWQTTANSVDNRLEYLGDWQSADPSTTIDVARSGDFVEFRIALSGIYDPEKVALTVFMINEQAGTEWTFAGLYPDAWGLGAGDIPVSDGYFATIPVSTYLLADFALAREPADSMNKQP